MNAPAEIGRDLLSKHQIQPGYREKSRLTWDGTAEPVSRDREILIFRVQLTTSRIGNLTQLIHTLLYVMTVHVYSTYVHILQSTPIYQYLNAIPDPVESILVN